ncbi:MAG TPA: methylated-DNA--[protein]-cysteine S-methyltransferase [Verrucomicrobiae bacterium]|nr:methylated-DNA--[protein]-cysteine S-methyltransferase [Verrucomicrobiae bacterium]
MSKFPRKNRVGAANVSWQSEDMNDYGRIAQVIRFLDERHVEQPDLATLAGCAGLSRFHFHRLFSTWAGVTPKDFLQCLTLAHAKELLRAGESILDAALESGLSGPGRLHDLCVNLEAASPGEWKAGGAGWTISFGFAESPFGKCLIAESPRGVCHLSFVETENAKAAIAELQNEWPKAKWKRDDSVATELAGKIFSLSSQKEERAGVRRHQFKSPCPDPLPAWAGRGSEPDRPSDSHSQPALRAFVRGTPFQVRVWRALLQVEPGMLTSYGRLAGAIGKPAAARAVGAAVGQNPLAFLIPCHRVIRETGVMGDYHWGQIRKRAMIAWESSPRFSGVLAAAHR